MTSVIHTRYAFVRTHRTAHSKLEARRGHPIPGTEVTDHWEPPCEW